MYLSTCIIDIIRNYYHLVNNGDEVVITFNGSISPYHRHSCLHQNGYYDQIQILHRMMDFVTPNLLQMMTDQSANQAHHHVYKCYNTYQVLNITFFICDE